MRERGYNKDQKFYVARQRSSYVGRRADALVLRAEERRDKLRKATGSGKYTESRRYLNGATRQERLLSPMTESIGHEEGTR